jgi:lipid A ethanolaminephosphotransferase
MNLLTNLHTKNSITINQKFLFDVRQKLESFHIQIPSQYFGMGLSLIFVLLFNKAFFTAAWNIHSASSFESIVFFISLFPLLWLLTFFLISLVCIPGLIKPFSIFLLIFGSLAAYFMDTYGVVIDREMLRNVLETDIQEASGLFNFYLVGYLMLLGIVPSLLVVRTKILWETAGREAVFRIASIVLSLVMSVLIILSLSSAYSSFFRTQKEVRFLTNPLGFVNAAISLAHETAKRPLVMDPISEGAHLGAGALNQTKPVLVVFVVGETARAANFGLGGYERDTTPLLAKQDIVYFNNVSSCGTSTAVSLPCMFSSFERENYSDNKAKSTHGLLDFAKVSGIDVLWRDNNSGCKGTCDRVTFEPSETLMPDSQCKGGECFDEILLNNISQKISGGNQFIVLHQKGSHGPAYDQRYPESMQFFTPVCKTNQLQECTEEQVVNAYDNSIRYTDYFLNQVINWLKKQESTHNTVMVYVSDHGESLGENNIYLHGMPYAVAPEYQTHVPFVFWASQEFYKDRGLSKECLNHIKGDEFSHDNIFHSFLGLLDIQTNHYRPELNMFFQCTKQI